jgi:hypothetical protein
MGTGVRGVDTAPTAYSLAQRRLLTIRVREVWERAHASPRSHTSRIAIIYFVMPSPGDRRTDIRSDRPAARCRRRRCLAAPAAPRPLPMPPASTFAAGPTSVETTTHRAHAGAGAEAPARSGTNNRRTGCKRRSLPPVRVPSPILRVEHRPKYGQGAAKQPDVDSHLCVDLAQNGQASGVLRMHTTPSFIMNETPPHP